MVIRYFKTVPIVLCRILWRIRPNSKFTFLIHGIVYDINVIHSTSTSFMFSVVLVVLAYKLYLSTYNYKKILYIVIQILLCHVTTANIILDISLFTCISYYLQCFKSMAWLKGIANRHNFVLKSKTYPSAIYWLN